MLNIKRREQKTKVKAELPYKRANPSTPVAEDIAKCVKNFGNAYDMVLAAAIRSKELLRGGKSNITGHQPTVTALLEIEQGTFNKNEYLSQVGKRTSK